MTPLPLAPLPTTRNEEESASWQNGQVGFVDDAVVARLLSPARSPRVESCPEDLVLAADDLDFAGWQLAPSTNASPFRGTEDITDVPPLSFRRATPPAISEPGIGAPHHGNHRWWMAGLAGAFCTLLFTLLLLILSSRPDSKPATVPRPPAANPMLPAGD
jgi:hypothetical protein